MGNRIRLSAFAFILAFFGGISSLSAQTITRAERPLFNWERDVLKIFSRNKYDKVIDMAQNQGNDPNGNMVLLTYYGHAQKYYSDS